MMGLKRAFQSARMLFKLSSEELVRMLFVHRYQSTSGRVVTPDEALKAAAVWACVTALSDIQGAVTFSVYQEAEDRSSRTERRNHHLYRLFAKKANPYMSGQRLRKTIQVHKAIWGQAFCRKVYASRSKELIALYPILPPLIEVKQDDQELKYVYSNPKSGEKETLTRKEIFHTMWFSLDGYTAKSPVEVAKDTIGLSLTADEFAARYFGNGTFPHLLLEYPGQLNDESVKQMREAFEAAHGGTSKAFRFGFLEGGVKVHQLAIDADKAQLKESREFQIEEIARIWRIPPHVIGHLLRATFNNIEHLGVELEKLTFLPHCEDLEGDIETQLLTDEEVEKGYLVEHDLDNLRRGDYESRVRGEVAEIQNALLLVNEARRRHNRPPVEGGDIPRTQMQMVPLGWLPPQTKPGATQ